MTKPERDLAKLIAQMNPHLHDGEWVFCSSPVTDAIMTFREEEGTTSIVSRSRADQLGIPYSFVAAWITLRVYSDLEAVGFLAALATALAAEDVSCNVVSAFHHDHLFVPYSRRHDAMEILQRVRDRSAHG